MKRSVGLFVALFAASGCGKSDSEKFADSYCAEVSKCCGQAGLPADGKMCHQWMTFGTMGGSYNGKAGDACLAEMRSQVSAGTFCSNLSSSSSACDDVFGGGGGNKKPGETCDLDSDCAPSSEGDVACANVYVDGAFIDKCQVQIPGKAGDSPCVGTRDGIMFMSPSNSTDVIPKGYVCDLDDGVRCANGACTALPTVGQACDYGNDCVRSAFCDYAKDQCVARVAAGATCTGSSSDECVDGYYCPSSGTQQCTAKLSNGDPCTSGTMCQSGSCSNGACESGGDFGLSLLCGS